MNADKQLKDILHMAVNNAVSRMKILRRAADRRCLFNEYKEWLGESINDEVLAIPSEIIQNELDKKKRLSNHLRERLQETRFNLLSLEISS